MGNSFIFIIIDRRGAAVQRVPVNGTVREFESRWEMEMVFSIFIF